MSRCCKVTLVCYVMCKNLLLGFMISFLIFLCTTGRTYFQISYSAFIPWIYNFPFWAAQTHCTSSSWVCRRWCIDGHQQIWWLRKANPDLVIWRHWCCQVGFTKCSNLLAVPSAAPPTNLAQSASFFAGGSEWKQVNFEKVEYMSRWELAMTKYILLTSTI